VVDFEERLAVAAPPERRGAVAAFANAFGSQQNRRDHVRVARELPPHDVNESWVVGRGSQARGPLGLGSSERCLHGCL